MEIYSVFLVERLDQKIKEYVFYLGEIQNIDYKNDWRFKKVKGKRSQLEFLGTVKTDFPVKYPLHLLNGKILQKIENEPT